MDKKIRFIGDIHGQYLPYIAIAEFALDSVQVGDFGVGFGTKGQAEFIDTIIIDPIVKETFGGRHRFIRGNHDSPEECKKSKHWIEDGTYEDGIFYMGGAASIDYMYRTEGVSWWRDEELSVDELTKMVDKWAELKPDVLVAHECSEEWAQTRMMPLVGSKLQFKSRTRDAISAMYAIHAPKIHIFGHWHYDLDIVDPDTGTRMICIGINNYVDINFDLELQR